MSLNGHHLWGHRPYAAEQKVKVQFSISFARPLSPSRSHPLLVGAYASYQCKKRKFSSSSVQGVPLFAVESKS